MSDARVNVDFYVADRSARSPLLFQLESDEHARKPAGCYGLDWR